jgi:hypothetical protein
MDKRRVLLENLQKVDFGNTYQYNIDGEQFTAQAATSKGISGHGSGYL